MLSVYRIFDELNLVMNMSRSLSNTNVDWVSDQLTISCKTSETPDLNVSFWNSEIIN